MTDDSKTLTITEYGVRALDGSVSWPDEDDELDCGEGGRAMYRPKDDLEQLRAAVKGTTLTLVQRAVTYGEPVPVPDPLPTAPGSVVRATALGGEGLYTLIDGNLHGLRWVRAAGDQPAHWFADADLTNVTIFFDAATVAVIPEVF